MKSRNRVEIILVLQNNSISLFKQVMFKHILFLKLKKWK
jgi:hypothetical protein